MSADSGDRLSNVLAALALGLVDAGRAATERETGVAGSGTPGLIALSQFLEGCNVTRLAAVLGLTHSGAVRLVGQLETAGYVQRSPADDRRQVIVRLTASGRRAAKRAAAARMSVVTGAIGGLTAAERRRLEPLIAKLVAQLVTARSQARVDVGPGAAWWCRACDLAACEREAGRCPAANAAAAVLSDAAADEDTRP